MLLEQLKRKHKANINIAKAIRMSAVNLFYITVKSMVRKMVRKSTKLA